MFINSLKYVKQSYLWYSYRYRPFEVTDFLKDPLYTAKSIEVSQKYCKSGRIFRHRLTS